jgi:ketosteroid isomerase-like protein
MPRLALHLFVALITCLTGLCAAGLWGAVAPGRPADTARPFRQLGSPDAGAPRVGDEQEVLELMRQYAAAQTRHDVSFFEQAEADSYVVYPRYGGALTKSQVISAMKAWDTGIRFAHEDMRVQLIGDVAIVSAWMTATHTGDDADGRRWRSIYLLRKSEGRWQILSATQAN